MYIKSWTSYLLKFLSIWSFNHLERVDILTFDQIYDPITPCTQLYTQDEQSATDTLAEWNDVLVLVDTCRKPILASMQDHYLVQARITCTVAAGRLDLQVYTVQAQLLLPVWHVSTLCFTENDRARSCL